jgi:S1/P1 Nuclease
MQIPSVRKNVERRAVRAGLVLALLASTGLWSSTALAWSARGHSMVGDMATQMLSPAATLAVGELLRDDLGADGKPSGRATLGAVASWPDELRLTPEQKATGVYHYDDVPICGVPDKAKYCPDGKCGTVWFKKQVAILKDRSQPPRARNEALKWIVHLAGDLHQPLHASDHDDKGGNDVMITFLGKRGDPAVEGRTPTLYNLHTAWDRLIPYRMFDDHGGYDKFLADLPDATTRAAWEVGDMDQWAAESFVLARDFIYPSLPTTFVCSKPITEVVPLTEAYVMPAEVIAQEQLRKAGVRLAKVLNDAFANP